MRKSYLLIQVAKLSIATTLCVSCGSKKSPEEHNQHEEDHSAHGHGSVFTDKDAVGRMAKNFESPERDALQKPDKIMEYLGDIKDKTLMDIGAGTGYFSLKFAHKGARVIAADVSDEFQNFLRQRIENEKINNVELRKTTYNSPLLKDQEVDIVFVANTYHHIENRTDYFAKVKKGLKEGGVLIVVDYFKADLPREIMAPPVDMRISVDQVLVELKGAGFLSFEVDLNLLPCQYILKAK